MNLSRRTAIKAMGLTAAAPTFVPARLLGADAPSKRIHVAMIGMGRQAMHSNLPPFLHSKDTRVVAVCDVDRWRMNNAKKKVDKHYKTTDCVATTDWRQLIGRDDIDAVMNSTTDQWHVPISLAAVRRGKHVSCEKPLTLSIAEGRILADAVKKHGVTFRTDSECRSNAYMHKVAELVRNGYIGQLKRIDVTVPQRDKPGGKPGPMPIPDDLDYDMWLGPAPMRPYSIDGVHSPRRYRSPGWMRCLGTCEGVVTNWGTHLLDVVQLAHNSERTGPVHVEGVGEYPAPGSGLWSVLVHFKAQFRYADGVIVDYHTSSGKSRSRAAVRFEGEDGWIQAVWFGRGRGLSASDPKILRTKLKDSDIHLPQRSDKGDFIYGIKTGKPTMADAEVGHRTCSMCQTAHIAIQVGKPLNWDPTAERFDNSDANAKLACTYREPWKLESL